MLLSGFLLPCSFFGAHGEWIVTQKYDDLGDIKGIFYLNRFFKGLVVVDPEWIFLSWVKMMTKLTPLAGDSHDNTIGTPVDGIRKSSSHWESPMGWWPLEMSRSWAHEG